MRCDLEGNVGLDAGFGKGFGELNQRDRLAVSGNKDKVLSLPYILSKNIHEVARIGDHGFFVQPFSLGLHKGDLYRLGSLQVEIGAF